MLHVCPPCSGDCFQGRECPSRTVAKFATQRGGSLLRRFVIWARSAMIRADISATEQWIADCARDGILDSRSLTECRLRVQRLRVDLEVLRKEAQQ